MRPAFATVSFAALALAMLAAPAAAQEPWAHSGELTDSDSQTGDEHHRYDDHAVRLEAGRRYRLSVNSEAFDPVARLYRAGEDEPVAENDDSGESLNSRISYAPQASGDYILRVTGFSADARGAYAVEVAPLPPLPAPISDPGTPTTVTGTWSLWQGRLADTDPDRDGKHYHDYLIRVAAGQIRYITLEGQGFDGLIEVLRASDRDSEPLQTIDGDDDSGPGTNPLLGFQPDEAGDYIVRVTSFGEGATGAYRLWISQ